jgi:hypothetical protein
VRTSSEEGESNSGISQRSVKKLSKPMKAAAMSVSTPIDLRIPVDCFKLSVLSTTALKSAGEMTQEDGYFLSRALFRV